MYGQVAKRVRERKEKFPEEYCTEKNCLYNTKAQGGGRCPRHTA